MLDPDAVQILQINEILHRLPLGCWGDINDVAQAVAFLADDSSKYITGQVLCVDGGLSMG